MPMDQEIKRQWIADLRDGTRKQGCGALRSPEGYQCCLDVLAEQAVRAGIINPPVLEAEDEHMVYIFGDADPWPEEQWELLPEPVIIWSEIVDDNPLVTCVNPNYDPDGGEANEVITASLAELNDDYNLSFEQIADVIETSPDL